jgi:hypothetical protein
VIIDKIVGLLNTLDSGELDRLPPARLQQFAALCRHWHALAEKRLKDQQDKSGVLPALKKTPRDE